MPISTLSIMKNATGATITGGTAMALSSDGVEVPNGVHVSDAAESNFMIRTNLTLRSRVPVRQVDGTYSKAKRFMTIVVPKIISDGSVTFNLVRIEVEAHPETTDAELLNLDLLGAQMFTDSDLLAFRQRGSLA